METTDSKAPFSTWNNGSTTAQWVARAQNLGNLVLIEIPPNKNLAAGHFKHLLLRTDLLQTHCFGIKKAMLLYQPTVAVQVYMTLWMCVYVNICIVYTLMLTFCKLLCIHRHLYDRRQALRRQSRWSITREKKSWAPCTINGTKKGSYEDAQGLALRSYARMGFPVRQTEEFS